MKKSIEELAEVLTNQIGDIGFRNGVIIGVTKWIEHQKAREAESKPVMSLEPKMSAEHFAKPIFKKLGVNIADDLGCEIVDAMDAYSNQFREADSKELSDTRVALQKTVGILHNIRHETDCLKDHYYEWIDSVINQVDEHLPQPPKENNS